jgi:serine/threonine-protein kinase
MTDPLPVPSSATQPVLEGPAERLRRLWQQGEAPDVDAFLAQAGPLAVEQLAQVLRVDQRQRWRAGQRVLAEDYLGRFPALRGDSETVLDLIFNEVLLREELGEAVDSAEYAGRFPDFAPALHAQFELHQALLPESQATALAPTAVPPRGVLWPSLPRSFGRYRVERLLGCGGMGEVYLAHDTQIDRRVALKLPRLGDDPERLARFYREARIAGGFTHPGLCPVYDVGELEGIHYFTMPFLEGETLAERLRGHEPLPVVEAVRLAARIARALEAAHAAGVVHRDLKPSNVMLAPRGEPVVVDFGLARRSAEGPVTAAGTLLGTPGYMAPEQLGGRPEDVGPACDIYSLGALCYEALTGKPPFPGPAHESLRRCLTETPAPPSQRRPGLAARLDEICLTALAREPGQRFASMAAFAEALEGCLQPGALTAPQVHRWRRRAVLVAAAGVVAALAGLLGHAWLSPDPPDPLPAGSHWLGAFAFRPPIVNYVGDVAIEIDTRDGDSFTGVYTTEQGRYSWGIAGTIAAGEARWQFTHIRHEQEPRDVVGRVRCTARLEGDELVGVFSHPSGTADLRLRRQR